jgi:hypothetical protein
VDICLATVTGPLRNYYAMMAVCAFDNQTYNIPFGRTYTAGKPGTMVNRKPHEIDQVAYRATVESDLLSAPQRKSTSRDPAPSAYC